MSEVPLSRAPDLLLTPRHYSSAALGSSVLEPVLKWGYKNESPDREFRGFSPEKIFKISAAKMKFLHNSKEKANSLITNPITAQSSHTS